MLFNRNNSVCWKLKYAILLTWIRKQIQSGIYGSKIEPFPNSVTPVKMDCYSLLVAAWVWKVLKLRLKRSDTHATFNNTSHTVQRADKISGSTWGGGLFCLVFVLLLRVVGLLDISFKKALGLFGLSPHNDVYHFVLVRSCQVSDVTKLDHRAGKCVHNVTEWSW